jgi:hypothetical protein
MVVFLLASSPAHTQRRYIAFRNSQGIISR